MDQILIQSERILKLNNQMRFESEKMQKYRQNSLIANPYEDLYKSFNFKIGQQCTKNDAESIARHLGFLHNAFGLVIKDFINIIKHKFNDEQKVDIEPMIQQKQEKVESDKKLVVEEPVIQNINWREQYQLIEEKIKSKKLEVIPSIDQSPDFLTGQVVAQKKEEKQQVASFNGFNPNMFEYKPNKNNQVAGNNGDGKSKKNIDNNVIDLDDSEDI